MEIVNDVFGRPKKIESTGLEDVFVVLIGKLNGKTLTSWYFSSLESC